MDNSISVIIAAYNCEDSIVKCINSALNQSFVKKIFVIDDFSTDKTLEIINNTYFSEAKVEVLTNDKNMGPSFSRNRALEICDTEWVTVLDSDDFMIEKRFESLLTYDNGYEIIGDDQFRTFENNPTTLSKMLNVEIPLLVDIYYFVESNITKKDEYRKELGFLKPLLRLSFIKKYQIKYKEEMRLGEDFEFYSRLLLHGARFILVEACGYVTVVRDDSLSATHSVEDLIYLRDCNLSLINDFDYDTKVHSLFYKLYYSINKKIKWIEFYTAIKNRNILRSISVLFCRLDVFFFITSNLLEQFKIRFLNEK
ncbi:glycosyltransferase family 2 protein [Shewanella sp. AC91-MNA-CIBAN-0169]|uniref:glycosyltransferase family 2 protein n=1 Tax=Shewanella sp. AC91-MNA-CIBAN-0169 TaxID=3140466 RepID=UPI00332B0091